MVEERALTNNGNGAGMFGTHVEVDEEPSIFDSEQAEVVSDTHKPDFVVQDGPDVLKQVEEEREATKGKRGKRALFAAFLLVVVLVTGIVCFFFLAGGASAKKARVPVNKTASNTDNEDAATRQAIEQLSGSTGVKLDDGSVVRPQASPGASPSQNSVGPEQPVTQLTQTALTQTAAAEKTSTAAQDSSSQTVAKAVSESARNTEKSVRIGEETATTPTTPSRRDGDARKSENASPAGVALPTFGSMLPVKSLGVIYSLRSGALARFELTRDVKGKGWSLAHGTVLVGALRGSEYNRAFISMVGFIDPESGKFVQLGGDLLGADGGAGVKGKRRQMSSNWSKVFRRLGEAGLNIAGGAASSIGRGPIIITDAYGQSAAQFGNEFNGVLSNKDRDGFVEIAAGTSCYVMITDLPEKVHGADAVARMTRSDLEEKADTDEKRGATGISEHELAELLQSGDKERIKAALPRMTPEMRRVAEAAMSEGGDR